MSSGAKKMRQSILTEFRNATELLSPNHLRTLSKEAVRIYQRVWNLMARKNRDDIWISDHALSISARVDFDGVANAKQELTEAGLFRIRSGRWPAGDPPNICHEYRFVSSEAT